MAQLFRVQGFSTTAGRTVEVVLWAESSKHARRQLEACGLRFVTVADWTVDSSALDASPTQGPASERAG